MDSLTHRAAQSKQSKLRELFATEGMFGTGLWALNSLLWKTRLYYALPAPLAEELQERFRFAQRVKKYGIAEPILVYQMGKVGSMSVYRSLRALRLNVPVYHLHYLNEMSKNIEWLNARNGNDTRTLQRNALGQKLNRELARRAAPRYNLISLVRAPIPHAVSAFCHRLDLHFPNLDARLASQSLETHELTDYFISNFQDTVLLEWFDRQVKDVFGIDVYAQPFDRERGYQIYEASRARLLLIRLEDLNRVATVALREFLNIPDFVLKRANAGEDNRFGEFYKNMVAALNLPADYVAREHSTRYAEHFYTPQELEASIAPWVR